MEVYEIKHMVRSQIHLLTPEFPPSIGGIASHSQTLADELRKKGHRVFVWCPQYTEIEGGYAGDVRAIPGGFCSNSLLSVGRRIRDEGGIVLLQWVPHGFGLRSYNILFCCFINAVVSRLIFSIPPLPTILFIFSKFLLMVLALST